MTCLAAPHAGTKNGLYVVDREDGRELAHISGEKQTLDVKFLAISSQQEVRAVSHQCQQWLCGTCSVEHSAGSVEVTEHLVPCMCGAVLCHLCAVSPVSCVICVLCHLCAVSPVRCVICVLCHLCAVSSVCCVTCELCHLCAVSSVCCVTCVLCHLCAVSSVRCVTCVLCHL